MFVTVSPAVFQNGYSFLLTPVANGPSAVGAQVTLTLRLQGIFTNGGPIDLTITGANPRTVHLTADGNGMALIATSGPTLAQIRFQASVPGGVVRRVCV